MAALCTHKLGSLWVAAERNPIPSTPLATFTQSMTSQLINSAVLATAAAAIPTDWNAGIETEIEEKRNKSDRK